MQPVQSFDEQCRLKGIRLTSWHTNCKNIRLWPKVELKKNTQNIQHII